MKNPTATIPEPQRKPEFFNDQTPQRTGFVEQTKEGIITVAKAIMPRAMQEAIGIAQEEEENSKQKPGARTNAAIAESFEKIRSHKKKTEPDQRARTQEDGQKIVESYKGQTVSTPDIANETTETLQKIDEISTKFKRLANQRPSEQNAMEKDKLLQQLEQLKDIQQEQPAKGITMQQPP